MKKYLSLAFLTSIAYFSFAQQEKLVPLNDNPALAKYRIAEQMETKLGKTQPGLPRNFPVTEHFATAMLDTLFWLDNYVTVQQKTVRFNAQSAPGTTYNGGDGSTGTTDQLTTKAMNFLSVPDRCYINFDYESGATWQAGDSLVLQAYNSAGNWDRIWSSAPISVTKRNVSFNLPLGLLYQHATFQLRFVCYSTRVATNTETFRLFNFVFALKQTLPFYENILWDTVQTYRNTWSKMQGSYDSTSVIKWGKVIRLNARDENGALYNNGFNDTIQSHSFDFSGFGAKDSVFFRFYYRAVSTQNTDSLVLQFKNNGGLWVDQMAASAAQSGTWKRFIVNVNRSRFNHADFQYRIITRGVNPANDTLLWMVSGFNIGQKWILPFIDDFSATKVYPNAKKWTDKLVFINSDFPIAPPSINVATFDGLNRVGVPYGSTRGSCDTLTSVPIKLDLITEADSVYLSFFIQPKGLGESPNAGDSLILELRSTEASPDSFRTVWRTAPGGLPSTTFTEIRIKLPALYFHDDFQLRFRNIGSRTGNLNHWHLDYIYLHKDRTSSDVLTDVAIQEYPSPLLIKYSSVPYSHFKQNPSLYLSSEQTFTVRNNSLQSYAVNYEREIFDQANNSIDNFTNVFNNFQAQTTDTGKVVKKPNVTTQFATDSAYLMSRFNIRVGTTVDQITENDTVWQPTYLGNYYAYDDGVAESGYSLEFGAGKVALKYDFVQPDTLYGMSIFYNRAIEDVTDGFNLKVWTGLVPEVSVLTIPAKAVYYNARNGFHYVKFETPIFVQNTVYIGWEQSQFPEDFKLNVGLDRNFKINGQYAPNPEMFFNLGGTGWQNTQIPGALMMRPIVGKWVDPPPVGLKERNKATLDATVYPNPSTGIVNISTNSLNPLLVTVYDLAGKQILQVLHTGEEMDLGWLNNGLYFIRMEDRVTHASKTSKILISR